MRNRITRKKIGRGKKSNKRNKLGELVRTEGKTITFLKAKLQIRGMS